MNWVSNYFSKRYVKDCHYHPWYELTGKIPLLKIRTKGRLAESLARLWGKYWCRKHHKPLWVTPSHLLGGRKWGYKCRFCGNYWEENVDPSYLAITDTIVCWAIKTGKFNKPVYALDEDVEDVVGPMHLPVLYSRKCKWSEKDKLELSKESKNWPRDSKGRWIK